MQRKNFRPLRRWASLLLGAALSVLALSCGVSSNDSYNTPEETTLVVPAPGVLGNDLSTESEPLTAALVTGPANASSFALNPDGSFTYTPAAGFSGADTFTYEANDSEGSLNTSTVTITVAGEAPPIELGDSLVGSSGTIDDEDRSEFELRNQFATIKDAVVGTVTYRYQLTATSEFEDCDSCTYNFRIRYRDTGLNQTVIVRLRAALLGTDGVETIYTFNSDTGDSEGRPAPPNVNANETFEASGVVLPSPHVRHGQYGYFLEVEIQKRAQDGTQSPGFVGISYGSNDTGGPSETD